MTCTAVRPGLIPCSDPSGTILLAAPLSRQTLTFADPTEPAVQVGWLAPTEETRHHCRPCGDSGRGTESTVPESALSRYPDLVRTAEEYLTLPEPMTTVAQQLSTLAAEISGCRLCDTDGIAVQHGPPLARGSGSKLFVIGIQPGRTELEAAEAFSGPAGKRLMSWLVSAGLGQTREEIFRRAYFTSLCKCRIRNHSELGPAVHNCQPFLLRQIRLLNPAVACTLGVKPLQALFGYSGAVEELIGRSFSEEDLGVLFPIFPERCLIVPLPHPSPRSRWLNDPTNQTKLVKAIEILSMELR